MYEFRVEIAGVPALIRCRHHENVDFFRDYVSDKSERFVIEPDEEDLTRIQAGFDRMDEEADLPRRRRAEAFLENNAIHFLLAERLLQEDVLLLHGSALCMDGKAYIFTAKSGTGKSTHARLWRETFGDRVWMINDDKPMLRLSEDGAVVYGTPWDGKHHLSRNASVPLKAIAMLRRDSENHIETLSRGEAFSELLRRSMSMRDPDGMLRIIGLERRLLDAAEFYALGCNMDADAARVAWAKMSGENPVY